MCPRVCTTPPSPGWAGLPDVFVSHPRSGEEADWHGERMCIPIPTSTQDIITQIADGDNDTAVAALGASGTQVWRRVVTLATPAAPSHRVCGLCVHVPLEIQCVGAVCWCARVCVRLPLDV
jgi:hypothetical protein